MKLRGDELRGIVYGCTQGPGNSRNERSPVTQQSGQGQRVNYQTASVKEK